MVIFTLTLIRHGETEHNKKRIIQGQQDTDLSEKGKRQAQLAAYRLQYERFTHAYASDLKRAYETCELILDGNKFSTCTIVTDSRIRERKFGVFEGKSADLFAKEARKSKVEGPVHSFVPHGGESNKQVRLRAREFFKDLCIKVKEVWDKEGNSVPPAVAGRRQRGASSLCSNSSEVFVSSGSPVDNNNMAPPELVLDTIPTQGKHDNSGSTSSTSGYSSGGTDSCEQLSPLEPSHSPGANIPQSYEGGLFQNVHTASQHMSIPPTHGDGSTKSALQVPMGCPNVSLCPIAEDHLMRIPSISSGRGSFDDTDSMLSASYNPDVLLVSHGGLLKEMILYFVDELGCELPGGKDALIRTPYNTSISKFTVDLEDDCRPKYVHCILLNDKDHLVGHDLEVLEKTDEV